MVPMLQIDDGTQLSEALAICRYFEVLHPATPLMGSDAQQCAVIQMWERRACQEGAGAVEDIFRNSHPLMVDRGLASTDEPVPQIPALVERGRHRLTDFSPSSTGSWPTIDSWRETPSALPTSLRSAPSISGGGASSRFLRTARTCSVDTPRSRSAGARARDRHRVTAHASPGRKQ